jgi:hypothetical protein
MVLIQKLSDNEHKIIAEGIVSSSWDEWETSETSETSIVKKLTISLDGTSSFDPNALGLYIGLFWPGAAAGGATTNLLHGFYTVPPYPASLPSNTTNIFAAADMDLGGENIINSLIEDYDTQLETYESGIVSGPVGPPYMLHFDINE